MGNILRCFTGDDDGGADDYPYYRPTSRPTHQLQSGTVDQPAAALGDHYPFYRPTSRPSHGLQSGTVDQLAAAFRPQPRPHQQALAPHGVKAATTGVAALARDLLNFGPTSMVPEGLGQNVTSSKKAQVKWMIRISGKEILARKYRIRMRGVDAPELNMPYGKESKNALVKLIGEKSVTIYVYDRDQFGRYVGDIYCDNVFIQEQMLKGGHVWHFKTYDKRPEFAKWERKARATHRGLWATENPEKPWDWRRDQRNARHDAIQVC